MSRADDIRRVQEAVVSIQRITNSRRIDVLRAERSGVPLSLVASGVLRQVVESGPLRAGELADRARMQPAGLSRQLRILEDAGCIERLPDPTDGRGALIGPTPRGRATHDKVRAAGEALFAGQLAAWTDDEVEHLGGLLDRLVTDLRRPHPEVAHEH